MRKKNEFFVYTCMWIVAVMVLLVLLMQSLGDARIVNYSGIVRGATQKLVKEEMNGNSDEELLKRLDGIIDNLQTGKGEYGLRKNNDKEYQELLRQLDVIWDLMKYEIRMVRQNLAPPEVLYSLSQKHFELADKMVMRAEENSEYKLLRSIATYGVALLLSVCVFTIFNDRNRKALENSIYTDSLTGLLNRAGFEHGALALLRQRGNRQYCLFELDVDDFKFLNNNYGYEMGDRLLQAVADGLKSRYHTDQLCARVASDDFVILANQASGGVEELRSLLAEVLKQDSLLNISEFITFTVGAYAISDSNELIQPVMDKANMAHKSAKAQGKSNTVWYNETFLEQLNKENKMKNRLHRSLEKGDFKMYLQPKLRLSDMKIQGAEALARWDIPDQGIIPPDQFIPLFERNGEIADIDYYMLEKACGYIRRYMEAHGQEFFIAVNFSRVTICRPDFFDTVLEIVDRHGIPHHCIEVEVTESAFNENEDVMVKKTTSLQEEGFTISMDDFGSGYSSLNLLDKLPIQVLKLDREFLREFSGTGKVRNVISCVTDLAHSLDIQVVCEGIEKEEHVDFLKEIGCDYGQGYYFSKPIPQELFRLKYEEKMTG